MTYELQIPDLPPSMNSSASGYRGNHFAAARMKANWEGQIAVALIQAKVPKGLWAVRVMGELKVPDRRRRDIGNFRMLLEKALGDVLVKLGHIPDDTPEHYAFNELTFEYEKGVRRTILRLETSVEDA
jgi:Holliday junction resolvase RusA-like endonuclease